MIWDWNWVGFKDSYGQCYEEGIRAIWKLVRLWGMFMCMMLCRFWWLTEFVVTCWQLNSSSWLNVNAYMPSCLRVKWGLWISWMAYELVRQ